MRRLLLLLAAPLALLLLLVVVLGASADCEPGGTTDPGTLSPAARDDIPPAMARIYLAQAKRWNLDVAFLASIGAQETDHGRNPAAQKVNSAGCQGVMQLGVGGRCGDFWGRNKCDGNADGRENILETADNVCAAANGLRGEKHAPPAGGSEDGYYQAACAYYGACSDGAANYAPEVMARAKRYGFRGGTKTDPEDFSSNVGAGLGSQGCASALPVAAGDGEYIVDPGANRPGVELTPAMHGFLGRMAELLPRPPIITTGTQHKQHTLSGNISDHWDGNGVDLGSARNGFPSTGGGYGNQIAAAAMIAAGEPPASALAKARRGGAFTILSAGLRVQVIFNVSGDYGNHYDHVHVGIKVTGTPA